ncbi:MAG: phosphoribosylanthranilate isomerase [Candidatus Hydrogenedentota bacterium]
MKVKICGITNVEDALAAVEAGADALGFVFAEEAKKRNRFITPENCQHIIERIPPFVTTVGVVVNAQFTDVIHYLSFVDCIQFHGEESPEDIGPLRHMAIKAFRLGGGFNVQQLADYPARAFLLDAYDPDARGGTGKTADWATARTIVAHAEKPVVLAGGLTPDNVRDAVRTVMPYGVDTSGGVEAEPGKKDHDRLHAFIHAAKASLA